MITPSKAAPQSPATVSDYSERELVARIQQRLPAAPGWILVGIGDDAAVVEPERNRVEVLSVDAIVEGVHFDRAFVPPEAIGHRAMAVNLSDLAAMGAAPRLALVSMVLPSSLPVDEFDGIADGLTALAARHGVQIAGGNLTRSPGPLVIDVTIIGTVKRRQALTRAGARPGDELYVTGTVGTARAGLALLRAATSCQSPLDVARGNPEFIGGSPVAGLTQQSGLAEAYLHPMPRLRMGTLMGRNRVASACMDLSDGLADAVRQVAEAGVVGAIIDGDALPIDAAAREWFAARGLDPVVEAAAGGDDYELLFAVRPRRRRQCEAAARRGETRLTRIGVCTADRSLVMTQGTTRGPLPAGYGHFRPFDALRVDELRVVSSDVEGR